MIVEKTITISCDACGEEDTFTVAFNGSLAEEITAGGWRTFGKQHVCQICMEHYETVAKLIAPGEAE